MGTAQSSGTLQTSDSRIFRDFFAISLQFFASFSQFFDLRNFAKTRFKRFRIEKKIDAEFFFFAKFRIEFHRNINFLYRFGEATAKQTSKSA